MDLIDRINQLAAQAPKQIAHISTEEATKNALVMPFINALGYNVFDPTEVTPELTADVGTKKGEKVDYAILKDGKPIILMEVKCCGVNLANVHASQLFRYFAVTEARFGILTDGLEYRFFSDLEAANKMDDKPFFIFNLLNYDETAVEELKKFGKSAFDIDRIRSTANELKYRREIKNLIAAEFNAPSEEFVRFFASKVYSRRLMQSVIDDFTEITKQAFRQFLNERIENRLKTALDQETQLTDENSAAPAAATPEVTGEAADIETTQDELDAYLIVKAILREVVSPKRIVTRDVRSYCNVLLDNTIRKTICRFHFNSNQKYLGLFDIEKKEERMPINELDDIYQYADRLKATVARFEENEIAT